MGEKNEALSLYVHWPFCLSKCPYCDFNSHVAKKIDHRLWEKSYLKEIDYFKDFIKGKDIISIFFGGGTPSTAEPFIMESVINEISKLGRLNEKTEITLEANPTSFEASKFKDFKKTGINRISLGIQALNDRDLKRLGRQHSAAEAIEALSGAKEIFGRVSFDLIYGRPGQSLKDWEKELAGYFYLASGHISLYRLTVEKATPFYGESKEGKLILPGSDEAFELYEFTRLFLESRNYLRYEISNYAIPGEESRHNLVYWDYGSYLGIGPGAHSRLREGKSVESLVNFYKPEKWLGNISGGGNAAQSRKILTENKKIEEFFMMGLRLARGTDLMELAKLTDLDKKEILNIGTIELYEKEGFLEYSEENIKLTDKGIALHNYIAPRILL